MNVEIDNLQRQAARIEARIKALETGRSAMVEKLLADKRELLAALKALVEAN